MGQLLTSYVDSGWQACKIMTAAIGDRHYSAHGYRIQAAGIDANVKYKL